MAIEITCPVCGRKFSSDKSYHSHLPCKGKTPLGAYGGTGGGQQGN